MPFSQEDVTKANRILGRARAKASKLFPYMTDAIYALIPHPCNLPPIANGMAVSELGVLLFDPVTIHSKWELDDVVTGLVHEAEHILRKHMARRRHKEVSDVDTDCWLSAVDAELGDDLEAMQLKLLPTDSTPKRHGLPDGKIAEWYFEELRKQRNANPGMSPNGPGAGAGLIFVGMGKGQPRGCCGSGAGVPLPGEDKLGGPKLTPSEREVQLESVREQTAEAIKGHGDVPANLRRWATEHLKQRQRKIPWEQQLACAARFAVSWKKGQTDHTYSRVNRRQGGIGWGIGKPILPASVSPVAEVALCQDTSGSMGGDEFSATIKEATPILAAAGGHVTLVSIDAQVHVKKTITSAKQIEQNLVGGGGTDFRPAFEALKTHKPKPSIIVFATDGYGYFPEPHEVTWCKTIWLMSTDVVAPFGITIKLDDGCD